MAKETQKINVRNIISLFETQSTHNLASEPVTLLKRAKSIGHLSSSRPVKRVPEKVASSGKNLELAQIEHQVRHLQRTLGNYKKYSRENHIYYQNQIFFLLTDIINVDAQDDPKVINEKTELIELMKRLNKGLNELLPSAVKKSKSESSSRPSLKNTRSHEPQHQVSRQYSREIPQKTIEDVEAERYEHEVIEEVEEVDAPPPSVKSLKQMFEKNTTDIEAKREFSTKLTRKFNTFSGRADSKSTPYSKRFTEDTLAETKFVSNATESQIFEDEIIYEESPQITDSSEYLFDQKKAFPESEDEVLENGDSASSSDDDKNLY